MNEEEEVELELIGSLQRNRKGGVSVEWKRGEGNSFWLSAIRTHLVATFSTAL